MLTVALIATLIIVLYFLATNWWWSKQYGKILFKFEKEETAYKINVRSMIRKTGQHQAFLNDTENIKKNLSYIFIPNDVKTEFVFYDSLKLEDNHDIGIICIKYCPYYLSEIYQYKIDINRFKTFCLTQKGGIAKEQCT